MREVVQIHMYYHEIRLVCFGSSPDEPLLLRGEALRNIIKIRTNEIRNVATTTVMYCTCFSATDWMFHLESYAKSVLQKNCHKQIFSMSLGWYKFICYGRLYTALFPQKFQVCDSGFIKLIKLSNAASVTDVCCFVLIIHFILLVSHARSITTGCWMLQQGEEIVDFPTEGLRHSFDASGEIPP